MFEIENRCFFYGRQRAFENTMHKQKKKKKKRNDVVSSVPIVLNGLEICQFVSYLSEQKQRRYEHIYTERYKLGYFLNHGNCSFSRKKLAR